MEEVFLFNSCGDWVSSGCLPFWLGSSPPSSHNLWDYRPFFLDARFFSASMAGGDVFFPDSSFNSPSGRTLLLFLGCLSVSQYFPGSQLVTSPPRLLSQVTLIFFLSFLVTLRLTLCKVLQRLFHLSFPKSSRNPFSPATRPASDPNLFNHSARRSLSCPNRHHSFF